MRKFDDMIPQSARSKLVNNLLLWRKKYLDILKISMNERMAKG